MKNQIRKLLSICIVIALVLTLVPTNVVQGASKVKLNKTTLTVYVGKTTTLKITGTSKTVKWSTSDKNVATVSSKGKVTAKKAGTATISAKVSNKTYKCKITVKKPYLNKKKVSLKKGKTTTLKLTGATAKKYKSSNKKVATVNSKGKVTAKAVGTATITCTDTKGKTYKCKVTVSKATTKHTHNYKWVTTKEATCSSNGIKEYKCDCGNISKTETIAKLEHEYDNGTITTKATCIKEGEKTFKCTRSGCTETKKETIAKTDHNYSWETNGNSRTMKCSCGETGITEECYNGVWGYFDKAAAEKLYYWVNEQRAATTYSVQDADGHTIDIATVPALTNFDGLYDIAKQRATEVISNWSHEGMKTDNENLANGCENAQSCYEAWCYSSTHLRTMTNQIYTQGSCAVFYYDSNGTGENLYPVYVLVVNK